MSIASELLSEPVPADTPHPVLHCCPYCGSGISRLRLYQGGILGRWSPGMVRARVLCKACGRQHALQGESAYLRGVVTLLVRRQALGKAESGKGKGRASGPASGADGRTKGVS